MNRAVAASLAVALVGTGLIVAQTGRAEEPSPRPTVIKTGPTDRPAFGTQTPQVANSDETAKTDADKKAAPKRRTPPPLVYRNRPADPQPPTSVIKTEGSQGPKEAPAKSKNSVVEQRATIRKSSYQQPTPAPEATPQSPITIGQPATPPPVMQPKPADQPPVENILPSPKPVTELPSADAVPNGHVSGNGQYPGYATNLVAPICPWTKCGKRACGSVYVDTPYAWMDFSYLFGWTKQDHTQVLVTSGAADSANRGALGDPGTTVLYDGQRIQDDPFFGGKFGAGTWIDECQYFGLEGNYFFFGSTDRGFITGANGYPGEPGLYIPYFNALTGQEAAFPIADPGQSSGIVNINFRTRLQGADGHFLFSCARNMSFRMDALIGVRWVNLDEDLTIEQNIRQGPNQVFALPSDVAVSDHFGTRNDFIGLDLGFKTHFRRDAWTCDLLTRIAIGGNHLIFRGEGLTSITFPGFGPFFNTTGGRLIGPANNGIFGQDVFAVVPEVGLCVGYMPRHWLKFTAGYSWTYWNNIIRPGGQVDRVVNPIGVPTQPEFMSDIYEPRRPGIAFNQTDIWFQSITLGMQIMY